MISDSIYNQKKSTTDSDNDNYGITSMDDTTSNHSSMTILKNATKNKVVPKVKKSLLLEKQHGQQEHFRMIVCGDSGIGKSTLVNVLTSRKPQQTTSHSLDPIEVFMPDKDICIVDTSGYGALLRAEVVFSHVKSYIEDQFEKTSQLFNSANAGDEEALEEKLTFVVYQSSDILTHVNVCLYLIMGRLKQVDIEYMKSIQDLVEIIPVIIQPDLSLRPEIRMEQRLDILISLETNQIKYSLLGYENYQELINACKQPTLNPHCPPFMLDWSTTKSSFHGLIALKQALFQHQYQYLHYKTTQKFIAWRSRKRKSNSSICMSSTLSSSASVSSQEQLKNIKISQYVTKRRHSMERELLIQEKKLQQEFDLIHKQHKTEFILKELNLLLKQDKLVIKKEQDKPMTLTTFTWLWILLSILLSLFICYQNRKFFVAAAHV